MNEQVLLLYAPRSSLAKESMGNFEPRWVEIPASHSGSLCSSEQAAKEKMKLLRDKSELFNYQYANSFFKIIRIIDGYVLLDEFNGVQN